MLKVEQTIESATGTSLTCVFESESCLPVDPIQRFLNYSNKRGLAANTVKTYAYRLVDFWRYLEQIELDWKEVSLDDLANFSRWYLMGGNVIPFSPEAQASNAKRDSKTVNQAITAICEMYKFHTAEGRVDTKQFTQITTYRGGYRGGFLKDIVKSRPEHQKLIKLKESRKFPGCLTDQEIERLVDACTTNRDAAIILLLRYTGMRRGELLGEHLEDILWQKRRIRIIRRANPNNAWAKGLEREIPVLENSANVFAALEHYLNYEYPAEAEKLNHGMLFVNLGSKHRGQPMTGDRLNKMLNSLYAKTGIKVYPHLFRHTYATRMLQLGYPEQQVQQLLGHRSIITTKDVYSHVLDEIDLYSIIKEEQNDKF